MRLVTSAADRLLSLVAPKATAAAGCVGSWRQDCTSCIKQPNHQFQKKVQNCSYTSGCKVVCGACYTIICP
jgi:hypothetical protein